MHIAIIPARGGSKRIPRKNIQLFAGKPIIAYSIEAAVHSGLFRRIIVSTDDPEIAEVSRTYGAEVPFLRPAGLADDYTVIADVMRHACEWLANEDELFNSLCCLYATAPMVQTDKLLEASLLIEQGRADYVLSVVSYAYPVQRALRLAEDGTVDMIQPEYAIARSQDLEECFYDAAHFFWGSRAAFCREVRHPRTQGIVIPHYMAQDIDTQEDWLYAEVKYRVARELGLIRG